PAQTPPAQTLTVSNGDPMGSSLNFTAAATGAAWLSVTPTMGTAVGGAAGMPLSVAVSTTGLGLGDYMGSITLSAPNAKPTSVTVPVVLHITDSGMPPADAGSEAGTGSGDAGVDSSVSSGAGGMATGGGAGQTGATGGSPGSGTGGGGGA